MDAITRIPMGAASDKLPRLRFRRSSGNRPAQDVIDRQSRMALLAFQAFGSRDAARDFLNADHGRLGGKPIEIAGRDDAGYETVRTALASSSFQA